LKSVTTERFRRLYGAAAPQRQIQIKRSYKLWLENPAHPSIRFKKVHSTEPIYSVRVDLDWRALGVLEGDTVVWFWVGPHDEYDALLKRM
jgi:hypothetical protein